VIVTGRATAASPSHPRRRLVHGEHSRLYVIDACPCHRHGGALRGVNPYDIESIQVLTQPSETALYGVPRRTRHRHQDQAARR